MEIIVHDVCQWCGEKTPRSPFGALYCHRCRHRIGVPKEECDCLNCTAARLMVPVTEAIDQPQSCRARGWNFHSGKLVLTVTKDGVWRRIQNAEDTEMWFEVFESKGRAIDVFKTLWPLLTPEERNAFLLSSGILEYRPL